MSDRTRKSRRVLCDCGQPALKFVRNEPICARCSALEQIPWHAAPRRLAGPFDPTLCPYRVANPTGGTE